MKGKKRFSSLHNHTSKSILDATIDAETLIQQATDFGYNAVAITEHGNMFSYLEGYKIAKEKGIKFIAGVEAYETTNMDYKEKDGDRFHLILLAKSNKGLQNLFKIVTEGNTRGFYGKPRVDLKTISNYSEDVICMSACLGGRIAKLLYNGDCACCEHDKCNHFEPDWEKAKEWVQRYRDVFGENYYIELQSHNTHDQKIANQRLYRLAQETGTKFTITFDTHLIDGSELQKDIHKKFIKIGQDREVGETYEGCWQTDIATIHKIMDNHIGYEAVEQGIDTTDEIAEQCNIEIELHRNLMPHIKIPKEFKNEQEYLKHLTNVGWKKRGLHKLPPEKKKIYKERLRNEFEVLNYLGYCSYFIMLSQLINKIKERNIPLGYSRGSGANSLTLYVLGVTQIDSIRWDLDFSRFANKGRLGSAADYDIDISKARRQEVLEIAAELFGEEMIAQVATYNSLSPKVCIRDLGKVFDEEGIYKIPYSLRDKISKLIPDDPNGKMTIEKALKSSEELQKYQEQFPLLFEYTKYIQNLPKSIGCHAAAVIIAPTPVTDYAPLMYNKNGNLMMQMDMHDTMDDLGLVKMDFLGLKTLDVIDSTLKHAGLTWEDISLEKLDLNDQNVFEEIYQKGNTLGIFQMESYVAQEMFKDMKADNVKDIFAVNAMNRPAVLAVGMDKEYIKNKTNRDNITYLHEDLVPVLKDTYGVMLYQEQALKIFAIASFKEDERDNARRAIGKKKLDVMKGLFAQFSDGLRKRNWNDDQVEEMWRLIEAQAGYSFNLGHSTAYGLLSYVTAYLKYYYPVEFMTALLTSEIGDYEQTTKYINECHRMGIKVLPPNINKSERYYTPSDGNILFGFESIKGVGENAALQIIDERKNGLFKDLSDFINRCKVDSSTIISLIKSGSFGDDKDQLLYEYAKTNAPKYTFKEVTSLPTKAKLYELNIITTDEQFNNKEFCLVKYNDYRKKEYNNKYKVKLEKYYNTFKEKYMSTPVMYEYETLSIFINGSPFDDVKHYFTKFKDYDDNKKCVVTGTITSIKRKKQRNGKQYAYIEVLTPEEGILEGVVFNTQLVKYQDIITKGSNVVILAEKNGGQFKVNRIKTLNQWKTERGLN